MSVQDWLELCSAAGFQTKQMKPLDVYQLAGRIIQDGYLAKIAEANHATREFTLRHLLTSAQLEALRARIQA
jgi:hypothetical protein